MNKQEAIKKIKKLEGLTILDKTINLDSEMILKKRVLNIVKQLDEPEKPVVPQFIDSWIQGAKYNGFDLYEAMTDDEMSDKVVTWVVCNPETFAKAWLFGYEVEKEKLYTVEIPNPNKIGNERNVLMKNGFNQIVILRVYDYDDNWRNNKAYQLTEAEIKQDFDWAWQFATEVEND